MIFGALLALAGAGAAPLFAQDVGLGVGAKAPAVTVQDLDGKPVDLGRYLGREPLVVEFWATWCPLCQALEPSLKAAHAHYGGAVRFVAIGVGVNQSPASIRRHLAAHPLPFPVLYDATGAAVRAYADREEWQRMMRRGMEKDFSWKTSSLPYSALYRRLLAR